MLRKETYKKDGSFSIFRLHPVQKHLYIAFHLTLLRFRALYGVATISRRQKWSNGVNRQTRFEVRFHLEQRGVFVGVRSRDERSITFTKKSFVRRIMQARMNVVSISSMK